MAEAKMNLIKKTTLEKSKEVAETLNWKVISLKENDRDLESGIADYIARGVFSLERLTEGNKAMVTELQGLSKANDAQIELIKIEGAKWMEENLGTDKLNGQIISSVSVTKGKPEEKVTKKKKEFKMKLTQEELYDYLEERGMGEWVETEVESISKATPAKLRINKGKITRVEVIENEDV